MTDPIEESPNRQTEFEEWRKRQQAKKKWSSWSIAGFALGIMGFILLPLLGGIIGIVCAVIARNEGDEKHWQYALWISVASAGLWLLYFLSIFVMMVFQIGMFSL